MSLHYILGQRYCTVSYTVLIKAGTSRTASNFYALASGESQITSSKSQTWLYLLECQLTFFTIKKTVISLDITIFR